MVFDHWPLPEMYRPAPELTYTQLQTALLEGQVLTGRVVRCDAALNLYVQLGAFTGIIPHAECVAPFLSGAQREIAVLSCVGRSVCFRVTGQSAAPNGDTQFSLSRRLAQEEAMDYIESHAVPGLVVPAQVTHLAPFGAFVDVGCGIISLIPLAAISVAHITHPRERFAVSQHICVLVQDLDRTAHRLYLSHRELLGTWLENAAAFHPGDTVPGILRARRSYGRFVELTPNLSGLSDASGDLPEGTAVSVRIRSILPARQKIKLQIVQPLGPAEFPTPLHYRITGGVVQDDWRYAQNPPLISSQ